MYKISLYKIWRDKLNINNNPPVYIHSSIYPIYHNQLYRNECMYARLPKERVEFTSLIERNVLYGTLNEW